MGLALKGLTRIRRKALSQTTEMILNAFHVMFSLNFLSENIDLTVEIAGKSHFFSMIFQNLNIYREFKMEK